MTTTETESKPRRRPVPTIQVEQPKCPACGKATLRITSTRSELRWAKCRACDRTCKIVYVTNAVT